MSAWLEKYATPEPNTGCWLWLGATQNSGYGHTKLPRSRKSTGAHRLSYMLHVGPIPANSDVCHKCDTKLCVNPAHLFVGSRRDNLRDCVAKGRNSRGESHGKLMSGERSPHAKLTWPKVRAIREAAAKGATNKEQALAHGVTPGAVSHIINCRSWKYDLSNEEISP